MTITSMNCMEKNFWFNVTILAVLFLYFDFTNQYINLLGLSKERIIFIKEILQLHTYLIPQAILTVQ